MNRLIKLTEAQADFVFHLLNATNSYHDRELPFMRDVADSMMNDGHDPRRSLYTKQIMDAVSQFAEDCA